MSDQSIASQDIRTAVRSRYGQIAEKLQAGDSTGCAETATGCCQPTDIQLDSVEKLYQDPDVMELPAEVTALSLGCGDPVTLAGLQAGQTVLDLGSGGGIDCFLAAKKVGESGKVIGVDMTPAMIERARANQAQIGAQNVEFRLGEIEHLPVGNEEVDVIISNCVINLSPDKPQVLREAFRVLRPGGLLAVSDIVTDGPLPDAIKTSLSAWAGCVAGALDVQDYTAIIQQAGFEDVVVEATYWDQAVVDEAIEQLEPELKAQLQGFDAQKAVFSARITARKPEPQR